jgi:hypothetical protein
MLKEISDSEDVLEVIGEFIGGLGALGPSHEHSKDARFKIYSIPRLGYLHMVKLCPDCIGTGFHRPGTSYSAIYPCGFQTISS